MRAKLETQASYACKPQKGGTPISETPIECHPQRRQTGDSSLIREHLNIAMRGMNFFAFLHML